MASRKHGSVEERKKLRQEYKALHEDIKEHEAELLDLSTGKLDECIRKAVELHDQVHHPNDLARAARVMNELIATSGKAIDTEVQGEEVFTAQAIITALKAHYASGDPSQCVDWAQLGQAVAPLLPLAPGMSTLLGPELEAPVARRQVQRRPRTQLPAMQTAQQLDRVEEPADKQETDKNVECMWGKLKQVGSTPALELVLNHESFSQTVENTFALQFLVKDGRVSMTHDEENGAVVTVVRREAGEKGKQKEEQSRQTVWHWTMQLWEHAKTVVSPKDCLMPHRQYKQ